MNQLNLFESIGDRPNSLTPIFLPGQSQLNQIVIFFKLIEEIGDRHHHDFYYMVWYHTIHIHTIQNHTTMIVLIGSEKGGTGKTTLATNLAAMRVSAGSDLLLIDTDPQGSASAWAATRSEEEELPRVSSIQKFGKAIAAEVKGLASKYDDLLIDTGGRNSIELRAAMTVADMLIIPIQASQFDVWTLVVMDKLVLDVSPFNPNLTIKVVLTRASTHYAVSETREAKEILEDDFENLALSKVIIYDRIAYRKAAKAGMSVLELKTEEKATKEMNKLYKEVFSHV